jgi:hypothetical protein
MKISFLSRTHKTNKTRKKKVFPNFHTNFPLNYNIFLNLIFIHENRETFWVSCRHLNRTKPTKILHKKYTLLCREFSSLFRFYLVALCSLLSVVEVVRKWNLKLKKRNLNHGNKAFSWEIRTHDSKLVSGFY